jgi:hypothetical protein
VFVGLLFAGVFASSFTEAHADAQVVCRKEALAAQAASAEPAGLLALAGCQEKHRRKDEARASTLAALAAASVGAYLEDANLGRLRREAYLTLFRLGERPDHWPSQEDGTFTSPVGCRERFHHSEMSESPARRAASVQVQRVAVDAYSGVTWAPIPEGPGQGFRNDAGANSGDTWALIPA